MSELFPFPPKPKLPESPLKKIRGIFKDTHGVIDKAAEEIRSLAVEIRGASPLKNIQSTPDVVSKPEVKVEQGAETKQEKVEQEVIEQPAPQDIPTVSETDTLIYQLDMILSDLQHLETEHLPQQGRIAGKPCDCISKASRDLRRHALETIPIASRQGKGPKIFPEMAEVAAKLMEIGTAEAVASGKYDEEYLKYAGEISAFRKEVNKLIRNSKEDCKTCEGVKRLKDFKKA